MRHPGSPVRILIDPALDAGHRPEVCWTWRLVLVTLGRAWVEVEPGEACDIAHVAPGTPVEGTPVRLCADSRRWAGGPWQLDAVDERDGWPALRFAGEPQPGGVEDHDVVHDVFWLATAQAERAWPRDRHGSVHADDAYARERVFTRALASRVIARLDRALEDRGWGPGAPRWPEGRRAAACLTHDVDYPEAVRWLEPLRVLRRRGPRGLRAAVDVATGRRTTWHFESWRRLEESNGARSAFYFVARCGSLLEYATKTPDSFYDVTAPRFRELFRELDDAGVEIGLHASYRAHEDERAFAGEKARLEEAAGREVVGNRHHYLHLDPERPEDTLLLHERLGFQYDSTLGNERYLGWRSGLAVPFFPFHRRLRREIRTVQLPFAWMDSHLFHHRAHNPGHGPDLLAGLADRTAELGGLLVVNIHDYVFDDELFPGWSAVYRGLVERLAASGDVWIATPRAVARHWAERAEAITRESRGLDADAAAAARDAA